MLPLTATLPKAMLPIGGKPLLEHLVSRAKEAGVEEFIFVVGHKKEKITDHFCDGSDLGIAIDYVVQEERLGTGHALLSAEDRAEDRFLVLNGDVLCDADSIKRLAEWEGLAVAAARVEEPDPERNSILEVEEKALKSVPERGKPCPTHLIYAGMCLLDRRIFDALRAVPDPQTVEDQERELLAGLSTLLAEGEPVMVTELESWIEIVLPWDVLKANETLMPPDTRGVLGEVEANATLSGEVAVGKGTIIRSGTYVAGPVVIGDGCDIGPNNFIQGPTSIRDDVHIGNGVVIEKSTIMEGTEISHLCRLGDSLIGPGCSLGVGTIVANRRHDGSAIQSYVGRSRAETGRRSLGAVLGEGVKTGPGTIIYPGTVIEAGWWGRPGEVLWGLVQRSEPKERGELNENRGNSSEKAEEEKAIDETRPAEGPERT